jgi:hypothetical protein
MLFSDQAGMDLNNKSEPVKFIHESGDDKLETLESKR